MENGYVIKLLLTAIGGLATGLSGMFLYARQMTERVIKVLADNHAEDKQQWREERQGLIAQLEQKNELIRDLSVQIREMQTRIDNLYAKIMEKRNGQNRQIET